MDQLTYAAAYITKKINGDARTVDAVVSSDTIDSFGDIIDQKSWQLARYKKNPIVLYQHQSYSPIGCATSVAVVGNELHATMKFSSTYTANEAWQLIETGALRAFSVGFRVGRIEEKTVNGKQAKLLLDCDLMEISLVSIPANPDAVVRHKSMGLVPPNYAGTRNGSASISDEALRVCKLSEQERMQEKLDAAIKRTFGGA